MAETGTILITGANGSLAVPAVKYLLSKSATYTCILTVRNTSDNDVNTKRLRETLPQYQGAGSRISIRQLDLSNLSAVHEFARTIASEVANGKLPPLAGIVCNAFYWNLTGDAELTGDGYDKSVQVNHIAHAALVLRLLGSFGAQGGRIVLFSSDAHWPGKNGLEKYPPAMPDDLELLVKPVPDSPPDNMGRGFQRYAVSKLADPNLIQVTVVAINPGNLSDSRALRVNTPAMLQFMSKFVIQPFRLVLSLMDPTMRTSDQAAADVIELTTDNTKEPGYYTLLHKDTSSPDSLDVAKQQQLWTKTLAWARITKEDTALSAAFQ